uniref:Uncharacterized protein n=1 Tax=Hyaloperonospora arabidopsidis (strain Emoy2) TaxID=559515 RepID=M4BCD2_HYAAE
MVRGHLFHRSFSHNAQSTGGLTRTKHLWSHAHKALTMVQPFTPVSPRPFTQYDPRRQLTPPVGVLERLETFQQSCKP